MYITFKDKYFSEIPNDHYDVLGLIALCDDMTTVLSNGILPDIDENPESMCTGEVRLHYFMRSFKNCFVVNKETGLIVTTPKLIVSGSMSLNDVMLTAARGVATKVFNNQPKPLIGMNCVPTPFGVIEKDKGSFDIMIQMCYNDNSELSMSEEYELKPFNDFKDSGDEQLNLIFKTLITVKE